MPAVEYNPHELHMNVLQPGFHFAGKKVACQVSFFTIYPCFSLVLVGSLCVCVFMCLLTAVCFVSAQLAVSYSIALDSVVGAGVIY